MARTGSVCYDTRAMASTCPRCGWGQVEGPQCPRCSANVAAYRAELGGAGRLAAPTPATPPPATLVAPAPARRPAGFWTRLAAILVDGVCLLTAQAAVLLLVWAALGGRPALAVGRAFQLVIGSVYPVIFHWLWGQTLGKMAMQIRVVTVAGGPLSLGTSVLREIGYWISALTLGIGYLMVAFRSDKRALHDLIAGTRVEHIA